MPVAHMVGDYEAIDQWLKDALGIDPVSTTQPVNADMQLVIDRAHIYADARAFYEADPTYAEAAERMNNMRSALESAIQVDLEENTLERVGGSKSSPELDAMAHVKAMESSIYGDHARPASVAPGNEHLLQDHASVSIARNESGNVVRINPEGLLTPAQKESYAAAGFNSAEVFAIKMQMREGNTSQRGFGEMPSLRYTRDLAGVPVVEIPVNDAKNLYPKAVADLANALVDAPRSNETSKPHVSVSPKAAANAAVVQPPVSEPVPAVAPASSSPEAVHAWLKQNLGIDAHAGKLTEAQSRVVNAALERAAAREYLNAHPGGEGLLELSGATSGLKIAVAELINNGPVTEQNSGAITRAHALVDAIPASNAAVRYSIKPAEIETWLSEKVGIDLTQRTTNSAAEVTAAAYKHAAAEAYILAHPSDTGLEYRLGIASGNLEIAIAKHLGENGQWTEASKARAKALMGEVPGTPTYYGRSHEAMALEMAEQDSRAAIAESPIYLSDKNMPADYTGMRDIMAAQMNQVLATGLAQIRQGGEGHSYTIDFNEVHGAGANMSAQAIANKLHESGINSVVRGGVVTFTVEPGTPAAESMQELMDAGTRFNEARTKFNFGPENKSQVVKVGDHDARIQYNNIEVRTERLGDDMRDTALEIQNKLAAKGITTEFKGFVSTENGTVVKLETSKQVTAVDLAAALEAKPKATPVYDKSTTLISKVQTTYDPSELRVSKRPGMDYRDTVLEVQNELAKKGIRSEFVGFAGEDEGQLKFDVIAEANKARAVLAENPRFKAIPRAAATQIPPAHPRQAQNAAEVGEFLKGQLYIENTNTIELRVPAGSSELDTITTAESRQAELLKFAGVKSTIVPDHKGGFSVQMSFAEAKAAGIVVGPIHSDNIYRPHVAISKTQEMAAQMDHPINLDKLNIVAPDGTVTVAPAPSEMVTISTTSKVASNMWQNQNHNRESHGEAKVGEIVKGGIMNGKPFTADMTTITLPVRDLPFVIRMLSEENRPVFDKKATIAATGQKATEFMVDVEKGNGAYHSSIPRAGSKVRVGNMAYEFQDGANYVKNPEAVIIVDGTALCLDGFSAGDLRGNGASMVMDSAILNGSPRVADYNGKVLIVDETFSPEQIKAAHDKGFTRIEAALADYKHTAAANRAAGRTTPEGRAAYLLKEGFGADLRMHNTTGTRLRDAIVELSHRSEMTPDIIRSALTRVAISSENYKMMGEPQYAELKAANRAIFEEMTPQKLAEYKALAEQVIEIPAHNVEHAKNIRGSLVSQHGTGEISIIEREGQPIVVVSKLEATLNDLTEAKIAGVVEREWYANNIDPIDPAARPAAQATRTEIAEAIASGKMLAFKDADGIGLRMEVATQAEAEALVVRIKESAPKTVYDARIVPNPEGGVFVDISGDLAKHLQVMGDSVHMRGAAGDTVVERVTAAHEIAKGLGKSVNVSVEGFASVVHPYLDVRTNIDSLTRQHGQAHWTESQDFKVLPGIARDAEGNIMGEVLEGSGGRVTLLSGSEPAPAVPVESLGLAPEGEKPQSTDRAGPTTAGKVAPAEPNPNYNKAMNVTIIGSALTSYMAEGDHMSGGQKALVGTQGAMGTVGLVADIGKFTTTSTALGGAGGVLGLGTSAYGFADAYDRGDKFGMGVNASNFVSSGAFVAGAGSTLFGAGEIAAYANPAGLIIGTTTLVVSDVKAYMDYGATKDSLHQQIASDDKQRLHDRGTPSVVMNRYSDISIPGEPNLPTKPHLSEYKQLGTLNAQQGNKLQAAIDKGDTASVTQMLNNSDDMVQYGKLKAARDEAHDSNFSILGTASPLRKLVDWNGEERNLVVVTKSEDGMEAILQRQAAAKEMDGTFEKREGQFTPRGFTERMNEYTALEQKGYGEQLAKLDHISQIHQKVWRDTSIRGMESDMGMMGSNEDENKLTRAKVALAEVEKKYTGTGYTETVGGKHGSSAKVFHEYTAEQKANITSQIDAAKATLATEEKAFAQKYPEVIKERAYFENEVAAGYGEAQTKLNDAVAKQQALQADLEKGGHDVAHKVGRGGGTAKVFTAYTEAEKGALQTQLTEGQTQIAVLQKDFNTKHEKAAVYLVSHMAGKEAAAELKTVEAMQPAQREAYFAKNAQFIKDAKLEKRSDMAWIGMSTTPGHMMGKVVQFAPEAVVAQSRSEGQQYTAAVTQQSAQNEQLRAQLTAFEAKGIHIPDAPALNPDRSPIMKQDGKPATFADLEATLQAKLKVETQGLQQLQATAAKYDTAELKAKTTIAETTLAGMQMQLVNTQAQNLSYKVQLAANQAKEMEAKQQQTSVAPAVSTTEVAVAANPETKKPIVFKAKGVSALDVAVAADMQASANGTTAMAKGDGGTLIAAMQVLLNSKRDKDHQITVDGKMGSETVDALVAYQKDVAKKQRDEGKPALASDGVAGKDTILAMKEDGLGNAQAELTKLVAENEKLAQSLKSMDQANIAMAERKGGKTQVVKGEESEKELKLGAVPDHLKGSIAQFQDKGFAPVGKEEKQGPGSVPMVGDAKVQLG